MIVYYNGKYLDKERVAISPDDRGFLFGDGTYEVIRIYHGKIFRIKNHLQRLARSLSEIRIQSVNVEELENICSELVGKNQLGDGDAMIYIQITRGAAPRRHSFPEPAVPPTIYITLTPVIPPVEKWEKGVKVCLLPDKRWGRCDIKSIALLANVLAKQKAEDNGAHEAIFIRDGVVTEGTHTNVCAVFEGTVWTHPISEHILDGITRDAVLALCESIGIPVKEEPIPAQTLKIAEEIFILGSSTEIMPVVMVDSWQVGNGKPGSITRKLQKAFEQLKRS